MLKKINQALMNEILEAQKKPIKYLVFGGGGAKGGVYTGVNAALMDCKIFSGIDSISGSSIGSMNASFLATGISKDKYYSLSKITNSQGLLGDQYFINEDAKPMLAFISSTINDNILEYFNNHPKTLENNEIKKIQEKINNYKDINSENITFSDLYKLQQIAPETFKGLAITGTRRDNGDLQIFDYENSQDLSIAKACRASMSIPFIFQPYEIYGVEYVDGGIKDNRPIKYFKDKDQEGRTLTFTFGADISNSKAIYSMVNPIATYSLVDSFLQYFSGTGGQSVQANAEETYQTIRKYALELLILDTANISTLSSDRAQDESKYLYLKGYAQTMDYFRNHNLLPKDFDISILDVKNLIIGVYEEQLKKTYIGSIIDSAYEIITYVIYEVFHIDITGSDIEANKILDFATEEYWAGKKSDEVLEAFIKKSLTKKNGDLSIDTPLLGNLISTLNDPYTPTILKCQIISIIKSDKIEQDLIDLKFERQDFEKFIEQNSPENICDNYKDTSFGGLFYEYVEYFKSFFATAKSLSKDENFDQANDHYTILSLKGDCLGNQNYE